ncbi:hypothetical protein EJB05_28787 [Eragrostis curvula]|uniref:Uncharacterized protein n=1 Tax=Eragrostis curvula TaxID=38414 RepID=A0A5J9UT66_9POAL|nr:hypothetical protein EJB05_28787 [Eragrostis curvula]
MQRGIPRSSPTPSCCVCHAGGEAQPRFVETERSHVKVGTNAHALTEADLDKAAAIIVLAAARVFKCLVKMRKILPKEKLANISSTAPPTALLPFLFYGVDY